MKVKSYVLKGSGILLRTYFLKLKQCCLARIQWDCHFHQVMLISCFTMSHVILHSRSEICWPRLPLKSTQWVGLLAVVHTSMPKHHWWSLKLILWSATLKPSVDVTIKMHMTPWYYTTLMLRIGKKGKTFVLIWQLTFKIRMLDTHHRHSWWEVGLMLIRFFKGLCCFSSIFWLKKGTTKISVEVWARIVFSSWLLHISRSLRINFHKMRVKFSWIFSSFIVRSLRTSWSQLHWEKTRAVLFR